MGVVLSKEYEVEEVEMFDTDKFTAEELKEVYLTMFDSDNCNWAIFDISNVSVNIIDPHKHVQDIESLKAIYSNVTTNFSVMFNPSGVSLKDNVHIMISGNGEKIVDLSDKNIVLSSEEPMVMLDFKTAE